MLYMNPQFGAWTAVDFPDVICISVVETENLFVKNTKFVSRFRNINLCCVTCILHSLLEIILFLIYMFIDIYWIKIKVLVIHFGSFQMQTLQYGISDAKSQLKHKTKALKMFSKKKNSIQAYCVEAMWEKQS